MMLSFIGDYNVRQQLSWILYFKNNYGVINIEKIIKFINCRLVQMLQGIFCYKRKL